MASAPALMERRMERALQKGADLREMKMNRRLFCARGAMLSMRGRADRRQLFATSMRTLAPAGVRGSIDSTLRPRISS